MYLILLVLQFPERTTREKVLSIHLLSRFCYSNIAKAQDFFPEACMMNIHRGANQGKTSMSKGALVTKFTNLNSFLMVKQGNMSKIIMSSIYVNKTKNISR